MEAISNIPADRRIVSMTVLESECLSVDDVYAPVYWLIAWHRWQQRLSVLLSSSAQPLLIRFTEGCVR